MHKDKLPAYVRRLITNASNASFDCGDYRKDETEETWEEVFSRSQQAWRELEDYIIELRAL